MQLGELEKQVLKYLWKNAEADVKQVYQAMSHKRQSSLNTVQSAVERLFRKGLLTRRKLGHAFLYQAKVDKEGLISQLIETATNDFVEKGESSLLAAFSSVSSRMDESELDALGRMIEQQRALRKSQ